MAARVGNIVPEGLWNGSNGSCRSASFEEPCLSHLVLHNLLLVGTWGSRTFWSCGSVCWIFFPLKGNLAATFWVASVDARTACIRALLPPPPLPKRGWAAIGYAACRHIDLLRLWEVLALSRQPLKADSCAAVPSRAFSIPGGDLSSLGAAPIEQEVSNSPQCTAAALPHWEQL